MLRKASISLLLLPFVPESLLYLIKKGRIEEAFSVYSSLNPKAAAKEEEYFYQVFNGNQVLNTQEAEALIEEPRERDIEAENKTALLGNQQKDAQSDLKWMYIVLMILSLLNSYLVQGIRYILPKTLSKLFPTNIEYVNNELKLSAIAELGAAVLTGILIEIPFLKRLRVLVGSVFLSGVFAYSGYFIKSFLDFFACSLKPLLTIQDQVLEVYSSEVFETESRVFFLSVFNISSSFPTFISPYLNDLFNERSFLTSYIVFGILSTVMFFLTLLLKKETYRKTLN